MHENHQREQYFFESSTVQMLADTLDAFERVCCLCTPTLGKALIERGKSPRILDIDERFADLDGFRKYDLYRPDVLNEDYDVIVCDPPFFNVSLSQLFHAIRTLCRFDTSRRVMVSYLVRREATILGTFHPFDLRPTSIEPRYITVQESERNRIRLYANFPTVRCTAPDGSYDS